MGDSYNYSEVVEKWSDAHKYSPAPRHRRRMIINAIRNLNFESCLDIGCAQPFLINEVLKLKKVTVAGCDISEKTILLNKKRLSQVDFFVSDISMPQSHGRKYDLVVCSEVLEHIQDWRLAVKNAASLSNKWLLVTVPTGKIYQIDKNVGHLYHFEGPELIRELKKSDFSPILIRKWGFPFHSAYKYLINNFFREKIFESFAEGQYGSGQKIISNLVYGLFFCNYVFNFGAQLIVLFERKELEGVTG